MDFDQLHAFLEVARLKSFSRAAMSCFRTQPAISAQIRLLEDELGERLFARGGGKVSLTEAGALWHDFAQRLLALRDQGRRALAEMAQSPRGELRIAANEGSCLHVLPEVFAAFKRQHPAVQVHIRRGEHNDILEEVLEQRADFGIVSLPVRDARLKIVPLQRDEICAVVAPAHPLAGLGEVSAERLAREPLLLPRTGQTREAVEDWLAPCAPLQVSMELDSTELLKGFAAAGLGVAFVASTLAAADERAGTLARVPLAGRKLYRELGLIFRRDRELGRAALAFIAIAVAQQSPR
ncbi:MAG: LysR substrate-binding domain-containing protein [Terriglobales bacterium]